MKEKLIKRKTPLAIAAVFIVGCLCGGLVISVFAGEGKPIGVQSAKQIALEHAGVTAPKAIFTNVELEREGKVEIYHIVFHSTINEYEFHIDARTGAVLEQNSKSISKKDKGYIGVEKAIKKALKHAKVTPEEAEVTKCELVTKNDVQIYDIRFSVGEQEYECAIHVSTGKIVSWDDNPDPDPYHQSTDNNKGNGSVDDETDNEDQNNDEDQNREQSEEETTLSTESVVKP